MTWAIQQIEPPIIEPDKGFGGFDFVQNRGLIFPLGGQSRVLFAHLRQLLLDAITQYLPSPLERELTAQAHDDPEKSISLKADAEK